MTNAKRPRGRAAPAAVIDADATGRPTIRMTTSRTTWGPPSRASQQVDAYLRLALAIEQRRLAAALLGASITREAARAEVYEQLTDAERALLARDVTPRE